MPEAFESYQQYHSFILLQSKRLKLAESLPWALFSKGDQINAIGQPHPDGSYNYSFDCSFYQHRGRRFVLAQAGDIGRLFPAYKQEHLLEVEYLELQEPMVSETYVYSPSSKEFIQTDPTYLHRSGIILFDTSSIDSIPYQRIQPPPNAPGRVYHFTSEYALASDDHFLNCLHRGEAEIGCYLRTHTGTIHPFVSERIYKWIDSLYPSASL